MRQSVPRFLVHRIHREHPSVYYYVMRELGCSRNRLYVHRMAADAGFSASLSYALTCLKSGDLQLKDKQVEALNSLYDGMDVFLWLSTGYGKSILASYPGPF